MDKLSFEEGYHKLEEIVKTLESGNLTLEEATKLFEEGSKLAQLCVQRLDEAELKITEVEGASVEQQSIAEG